jgi:sterol desaturase/sphingolipid hydroxylase (fatty acid hydroxylase superfamily)
LLIRAATAGLVGQVTIYAVAFIGVALHYFAAARRDGAPISVRAFGRHLLPRELLVSRWTRLDLTIYVLNKLAFSFVFPSVAVLLVLASRTVQLALGMSFGTGLIISQNAISLTVFLVGALLIRDFASFYVHQMLHRVPLLWEFHKVHHAPESLIPPTGHRLHPLDQLVNIAAESALLGILVGFYAWLAHEDLTQLILLSVGLYTIINAITFSPLQHSHIDLRLGWLERILLSPAHHRLHHSVERHHWDKNFAAIFPFWDRMYHTLLAPPPAATYLLGLPDGTSQDYATLADCYLAPFRKIGARLRIDGIGQMLSVGPIINNPRPEAWPSMTTRAKIVESAKYRSITPSQQI